MTTFRYEIDSDFDPNNPETWYDGDLIQFKDARIIGNQNLFSILKTNVKTDKVRIMVNKLGHGEWYSLNEVIWISRPLFP